MEGAKPADVIKVELLDILCDSIGTTTTLPAIGPLHDRCETRTKRIPVEGGKARFNDIEFPINTMIGVIGCAPEAGKSVPCGFPGSHGGNLDCKLMVKGNTGLLPRSRGRRTRPDGRSSCRHGRQRTVRDRS